MQFVLAFFVINLMLVLILRVLVALFEGVCTLWSVRGVGLECLVIAIRRNLVLLFLLMFVLLGVAIAVVATLPLVVLTMIRLVMSATVAVAQVTLFCNTMDVLLVTLLECVMKILFCTILDLMLRFLHKGAISHLQVENVFKVFCDRLKYLIAKALSAFDILCVILRAERHGEPLKL
jgi:hypothetical protein